MNKQLAAILALSGFIFSAGAQSAQQPPGCQRQFLH